MIPQRKDGPLMIQTVQARTFSFEAMLAIPVDSRLNLESGIENTLPK